MAQGKRNDGRPFPVLVHPVPPEASGSGPSSRSEGLGRHPLRPSSPRIPTPAVDTHEDPVEDLDVKGVVARTSDPFPALIPDLAAFARATSWRPEGSPPSQRARTPEPAYPYPTSDPPPATSGAEDAERASSIPRRPKAPMPSLDFVQARPGMPADAARDVPSPGPPTATSAQRRGPVSPREAVSRSVPAPSPASPAVGRIPSGPARSPPTAPPATPQPVIPPASMRRPPPRKAAELPPIGHARPRAEVSPAPPEPNVTTASRQDRTEAVPPVSDPLPELRATRSEMGLPGYAGSTNGLLSGIVSNASGVLGDVGRAARPALVVVAASGASAYARTSRAAAVLRSLVVSKGMAFRIGRSKRVAERRKSSSTPVATRPASVAPRAAHRVSAAGILACAALVALLGAAIATLSHVRGRPTSNPSEARAVVAPPAAASLPPLRDVAAPLRPVASPPARPEAARPPVDTKAFGGLIVVRRPAANPAAPAPFPFAPIAPSAPSTPPRPFVHAEGTTRAPRPDVVPPGTDVRALVAPAPSTPAFASSAPSSDEGLAPSYARAKGPEPSRSPTDVVPSANVRARPAPQVAAAPPYDPTGGLLGRAAKPAVPDPGEPQAPMDITPTHRSAVESGRPERARGLPLEIGPARAAPPAARATGPVNVARRRPVRVASRVRPKERTRRDVASPSLPKVLEPGG